MNQQQRKYVTQRIQHIYNNRKAEIEREFNVAQQNLGGSLVVPAYHSHKDILLALAGFESPAVMRYQGEELKMQIEDIGRVNPRQSQYRTDPFNNGAQVYYPDPSGVQKLVYPSNQAELDQNEELINQFVENRKTQLIDRTDALTLAYNRCMDQIMLGEYSHQIQAAISAFENLEV
jgi:hypothetical protein